MKPTSHTPVLAASATAPGLGKGTSSTGTPRRLPSSSPRSAARPLGLPVAASVAVRRLLLMLRPTRSLPVGASSDTTAGETWLMTVTFSISGFEYVEAAIAVDEVDEAAGIHFHVVGLGRRPAAARLGYVPADFLRRQRVADVHDAQPAGEPRAVDERAFDVLLELVRAETPALARPRRVDL